MLGRVGHVGMPMPHIVVGGWNLERNPPNGCAILMARLVSNERSSVVRDGLARPVHGAETDVASQTNGVEGMSAGIRTRGPSCLTCEGLKARIVPDLAVL